MSRRTVDSRLRSAVRVMRELLCAHESSQGFVQPVQWQVQQRQRSICGLDDAELIEELDSTHALAFLADLEQRYQIALSEVRTLLLDRLTDPRPSP